MLRESRRAGPRASTTRAPQATGVTKALAVARGLGVIWSFLNRYTVQPQTRQEPGTLLVNIVNVVNSLLTLLPCNSESVHKSVSVPRPHGEEPVKGTRPRCHPIGSGLGSWHMIPARASLNHGRP